MSEYELLNFIDYAYSWEEICADPDFLPRQSLDDKPDDPSVIGVMHGIKFVYRDGRAVPKEL